MDGTTPTPRPQDSTRAADARPAMVRAQDLLRVIDDHAALLHELGPLGALAGLASDHPRALRARVLAFAQALPPAQVATLHGILFAVDAEATQSTQGAPPDSAEAGGADRPAAR
jgi:hypothetical protein